METDTNNFHTIRTVFFLLGFVLSFTGFDRTRLLLKSKQNRPTGIEIQATGTFEIRLINLDFSIVNGRETRIQGFHIPKLFTEKTLIFVRHRISIS